jgi:hypothetical protein
MIITVTSRWDWHAPEIYEENSVQRDAPDSQVVMD